jgi:hypothetical protein
MIFLTKEKRIEENPLKLRLDQGKICWQLLAIPRKTVAGRHVIFGSDCPFVLLFFVSVVLLAFESFFGPVALQWPVDGHKKKVK